MPERSANLPDTPYFVALSPHDHGFAGHSGYLHLTLSYILSSAEVTLRS